MAGLEQHFLDARRAVLDDLLELLGMLAHRRFDGHADKQRVLRRPQPRCLVAKLLLHHRQAGIGVGTKDVVAHRREVEAAQRLLEFPGMLRHRQRRRVADMRQQGREHRPKRLGQLRQVVVDVLVDEGKQGQLGVVVEQQHSCKVHAAGLLQGIQQYFLLLLEQGLGVCLAWALQVHQKQQGRVAQQGMSVVDQRIAQAVVGPLLAQAQGFAVARVDGLGQPGQQQHLAHDVGEQRHSHMLANALVQK